MANTFLFFFSPSSPRTPLHPLVSAKATSLDLAKDGAEIISVVLSVVVAWPVAPVGLECDLDSGSCDVLDSHGIEVGASDASLSLVATLEVEALDEQR